MRIARRHVVRLIQGFVAVLGVVAVSAARAQIQTQKLTASDAYAGQQFGSTVAADDDWIVVGVIDDDQAGSQAGAAYMFQRVGSGFVETQKVFASDAHASDLFGFSVAIGGSIAVVGAMSDDFGVGSAYVFERVRATWVETAKLTAAVPVGSSFFGWAVAMDGNRIVVGAREEANRGAAYVFERLGAGWTQTARLAASDGQVFDFFGQSVAIDGDTILVGSAADSPLGADRGAAYLFEFSGVSWNQIQKLYAGDGLAANSFATRVALENDRALIGASKHAHGVPVSGSAYVFERVGAVWSETQELRSHAPGILASFGAGLALRSDLMILGASTESSPLQSSGAGYVFRRVGGSWEEAARFVPNDHEANDGVGSRVALNGSQAVMGVPYDDDVCPTSVTCNSGAVYVFDLAPDARQFGWCMTSAPCGNTFNIGGCLNSTGVGATLAAAGSSSVVRNELRFEVRDVQPNRNAIVFMGNGVGQAVLGDGLRVVASGTSGFYRFGVQLSGADGSFQQAGIVAKSQTFATPGHIQAGSVWNFQCWYRDPNGPCGKGTNVTNAVEVTFGP